jgi:single-strand DNA-binding protein
MRQVRGTKNAVELIGWMGGDPDMRITPNGSKVCRFSVATKYVSGSDDRGNLTYETHWTAVEAWERLAERCNTYLHKGSRILINGSLRTDTWTDKESGVQRSRTFVRAEEVIFLDSRNESANEPAEEDVPVGEGEPPF